MVDMTSRLTRLLSQQYFGVSIRLENWSQVCGDKKLEVF